MATSAPAQRIRSYALGIRLAGALVAVGLVASIAVPSVVRAVVEAYESPWLHDEPAVATSLADGSWRGDGPARLPLDGSFGSEPVRLQLTQHGDDHVSVFVAFDARDDDEPEYIGLLWTDGDLVVPYYENSQVWIVANGSWTIDAAEADVPELVTSVSGSGETSGGAWFVYRGDATGAEIRGDADTRLWVWLYSPEGQANAAASDDMLPRRFVWAPAPYVLIEVNNHDTGAWEIVVEGAEQ